MGNFENISAGAISSAMPECLAVIVNIGGCKGIMDSLYRTFPTRGYKVYVVDSSMEKLPQILHRCGEIGIPAIVNCGTCDEASIIASLPQGKPYTATIAAPGSGNPFTEHVLNDKYAAGAAFIGFQGYYFSPDSIEKIRSRYFEELRLGAMRENIALVEPLLRNSNYTFIDMKSVRHADYPLPSNPYPNGMYAEEICQLARYAGFGLETKAVFLYSLPEEDDAQVCSRLVAETIWHLCEGFAANISEDPNNLEEDGHFVRKIVGMGDNGEEIVFINSYTTDRWWMEISSAQGSGTHLVPCSSSDYRTACCGEIPMRWLFFYQKFALL